MTVRSAISAGCRHAFGAPKLLAWLWLLTLLAAVPSTLVVHTAVERSIGPSRMHENLRQRFDMNWYSEYEHEAVGVERLLTPTSVRPAALLDNLDDWWSGRIFRLPLPIVALGVLFALLWTLLVGGILYRYAFRQRGLSLRRLLEHGAELLPRFLRLLLLTAIAYYGVYRGARWLFPELEGAMIDVTVERTVLAVYLAAALLVVALLLLVKLISDYAKAATVLERRRSMVLAAWRALRFVARHPRATFGPYVGVALAAWSVLGLWTLLAPGHGQSSLAGVTVVFLYGQLAVGVRLLSRLCTYGAAIEVYRRLGPGG